MGTIPSRTLSRLSREFLSTGDLITAAMIDPAAFAPYATKASVQSLLSLVSGLSPVAASGSYADLTGKPDIPQTASDVGAATAAQGARADAAHAWGDHALAGYVTGDVLRPVVPVVATTDPVTFTTADSPAKTITIQVGADGRVLVFTVA